jgi:hypothetical protein
MAARAGIVDHVNLPWSKKSADNKGIARGCRTKIAAQNLKKLLSPVARANSRVRSSRCK